MGRFNVLRTPAFDLLAAGYAREHPRLERDLDWLMKLDVPKKTSGLNQMARRPIAVWQRRGLHSRRRRAAVLAVAALVGPSAAAESPPPGLEQVLIVFKTHFDIGYTDVPAFPENVRRALPARGR